MAKVKMTADIIHQTELAKDIFSLTIKAPAIAKEAKAGQFVSLFPNDESKLLPRPISICGADPNKGTLRLVYRIAGEGTREFSEMKAGGNIDVMGPLGNGFDLTCENPILMGGGIGIPPMLFLAKALAEGGLGKKNISVILGYRDEAFLADEFKKYATVYLSSDSGAVGIKGNVIDCANSEDITGDMIYACGPTPMLRAIKQYAYEKDIPAQISMEERMACGIGACLACVCRSTERDDHFGVRNKRVCKDGPVFWAEEVQL